MKIVIDTNGFISCIGKKSACRKVFDAFLNGQFTLCLTTEVLFEYEEKFNEFWSHEIANNIIGTILTSPNISLHSVYYNFYLVQGDADDNKFSDAYISSNADILISNDAKLLKLNSNFYPPIKVLTLEEFMPLIT